MLWQKTFLEKLLEKEPVALFAEACVVLLCLCGSFFLLRGRRVPGITRITAKEDYLVCV